MNSETIMKLVDGYVESSAKYEHIIEHYAQTEFQIAQAKDDLAKVRAAVVAALEVQAKDAERYKYLRSTTNWASNSKGGRIDVANQPELWDQAIDAAIAAQKEQV